ncbi:MAG: TRAP transporter substrate-binding protein DctP [Pseudomonadales bacterium]
MLNRLIQSRHLNRFSCTLALAASVSMATLSQAAEKVVLAHPMPQEHIFSPIAERFQNALASKLPESFDIQYHPGGDLGDWTSLVEQTIAGEIGMSMSFHAANFDPRLNVANMGLIANNWQDAAKIYGPDGEMTKIYSDIYGSLNMQVLAVLPVDFGGIAIRKGVGKVPVNFPEDAAGIKVRVPPIQLGIKRFEVLGFNPVPMPFSELYTALQLGAIDGRTFGPPSEIWQMRDVLETYVFTRDYFEHGVFLVNNDWWQGLEQAQRDALQESATQATAWAWQEAESISAKLIEDVKGYGINVVELDPAQQQKLAAIIKRDEWSWMEQTVGKDLVDRLRNTTH